MKEIEFEKKTLEKVIIDNSKEIIRIQSCFGDGNYAALFKRFLGRYQGIIWFKGEKRKKFFNMFSFQDSNNWEYVKVEQYVFIDEEKNKYSKKFKIM